MEKKQIDWEERHFQIVLALLTKPVYPDTSPVFGLIISTADEMVRLLKERETELSGIE